MLHSTTPFMNKLFYISIGILTVIGCISIIWKEIEKNKAIKERTDIYKLEGCMIDDRYPQKDQLMQDCKITK